MVAKDTELDKEDNREELEDTNDWEDIPELKMSQEDRDELIEYVCDELKTAVDYHDGSIVPAIDKYQKIYRMEVEPKTWPWKDCSNIASEAVTVAVDGIESRVMRVIWETGEIAMVEAPVWATEEQKKAIPQLGKFIDDVIRIKLDAKPKFRKLLHKALIERSCILKLRWVKDTKSTRDVETYSSVDKFQQDFATSEEAGISENGYNRYTEDLQKGKKTKIPTKYKKVKAQPVIDIVERKDFITPKDAESIQTCEFVAQRIENVRWDDIANKVEDGIYDKKQVDKLKEKVDAGYKENEKKKGLGYKNKTYTLYECIWSYDVNSDGLGEDILITLDLENKIWLQLENYPYRHKRRIFIPFRCLMSDGWDGVSIAEKGENLVKLDQDLRNIEIDSRTIETIPIIKARIGSDVELGSYDWYPGAIWWSKEPEKDLMEFGVTPRSRGLKEEIMIIESKMEILFGISAYSAGRESPGDRNAPAKKAMLLIQEGNIRINDYKDVFQEGFNEFCQQLCLLYCEFGTDEELKYFGITDRSLLKNEDLNFKIRGTTVSANKDIQRQDAVFAYNLLIKNPLVAGNPVYVRNLSADLVQAIDKDPNRYLPTEEELEQQKIEQEQKEKEARLKQLMGGMQPPMGAIPQPVGQPPGTPVRPAIPPNIPTLPQGGSVVR